MSGMRFLMDEQVPPALEHYLRKKEPSLDVVRIGGPGAPPKGTLDPGVLLFAEAAKRAVITDDHTTMPVHAADHLAAGHYTWGIFLLRPGFSVPDHGNDILTMWAASEAEEWQNGIEWIPF
jgi:hypothetical protein